MGNVYEQVKLCYLLCDNTMMLKVPPCGNRISTITASPAHETTTRQEIIN